MVQEVIDEIEDLKGERESLEKEMKAVKKHYDNEYIRIRRMISKIESKLRKICEHEWIRANHLYSDLYCKHCMVWKR